MKRQYFDLHELRNIDRFAPVTETLYIGIHILFLVPNDLMQVTWKVINARERSVHLVWNDLLLLIDETKFRYNNQNIVLIDSK
jgi:hypothetical protein